MCRKLIYLISFVLMVVFAWSANALAVTTLVDNFNSYALGPVDTVTTNWKGTANTVIEGEYDNAINQVIRTVQSGSQCGVYCILSDSATIPNDGTTKTLFFRFRASNASTDQAIGLTELDTPITASGNNGGWDQFRAQIRVTGGRLDIRHGGTWYTDAATLNTGWMQPWYNVWMVITNNATGDDTFKVYMHQNVNTGATENNRLKVSAGTIDTFNFRTNVSEALDRFYWKAQTGDQRIWLDTIYVSDGVNLVIPEPAITAKASNPKPSNGGTVPTSSTVLQWNPGTYAAKQDVYLGTDFNDVNDATRDKPLGVLISRGQEPNSYSASGLIFGATYYWRIDGVNDPNIWRGNIWNFRVQPLIAYNPSPANEAEYLATDVNLVWSAGAKAKSHDVYFGTTNPPSFQVNQTATTYMLPTLEYDTLYYWRINEVNGTDVWTGDVWSFTTRPYIPITEPNLIGWWKLDDGEGTRAVDWSGYYNRGTLMPDVNGPVWTDGVLGGALQFDGIDDYVNCGNDASLNEPNRTGQITLSAWIKTDDCGNGQYNPYITKGDHAYILQHRASNDLRFAIYSAGGWYGAYTLVDSSFNGTWHHLAGTYDGSQFKLYVDCELKATTDYVGYIASETANVNLGRSSDYADRLYAGALDDVRIYNRALSQAELIKVAIPSVAWRPRPDAGATDAEPTLTLIWNPGNKAAEHDVYFSDNFDDVNDANSLDQSGPTETYRGSQDANDYIISETLEWGQTYYWRIDEVNDPNIWRGDIWSFTVRNYLPVDDFESYTNSDPHIIFKTWKDGVGYSPGNGTGSQVGYRDPNYAELTIVHGGRQSMPFDYNNLKSPYYSEADRTFDTPQNWTASGSNILKSLTLWFRGYPVSVGGFVESPAGTYTVAASGANIGDVSPTRGGGFHDECHFGYKEATSGTSTTLPTGGTFTGVKIVAKVESVGNSGDSVGKAGVMIRDSLDANSVNGFMCVRRIAANTYGVAFQYRLAQGGSTTQDVNDEGITLPCWVALTLQTPSANRNVRAYYSHDGTTWLQLGTVQNYPTGTMYLPKPGNAPIYLGLAATPQSDTATRIAKFSSVDVTTGAAGAWVSRDIGIKSNAAVPTPLYVTLQDSNANTAKVTHPNPYIVLQNTWQQWNIALSDFKSKNPSLELTNIKKITIGVGSGSAGGSGTLYFDDIRVYMPRCVANAVAPDFTGSGCLVDNQDLRILTDNWLISDYQVTPATSWDPNNDVNLVARYRFDGNYNDSKGTNNGDPCNTSVAIVNDATRGQVASFDGINSYIALKQMDGNDFTLSAWIKASTPGAQTGTRAYQGSGLIWSDVSGDFNDFILAVLGTKLSAATGPSTNDITSIGDVVTGQWVHVAMVRTRSTGRVELYINGMLDRASISGGTGSLTANSRILIGANTLDGYYYKGLVDDVWIYDRALTPAQVAQLAGKTMTFNQPLSALVTNIAVDLNNDGRIDIRDYAILASKWLETLLFP